MLAEIHVDFEQNTEISTNYCPPKSRKVTQHHNCTVYAGTIISIYILGAQSMNLNHKYNYSQYINEYINLIYG